MATRCVGPRVGAVAGLVLALALVAGSPAVADKTAPSSRAQLEFSYAPLVKRVAPAVVNIYTKTVVKQPVSPFFDDPFFRRFFGNEFFGGQQRKRIQNSLGSGVIVDAGGLVVTNHHVIKGADKITVVLADRNEYDAQVVQKDERADLAVLRVDTGGKRLPFLEMRDADELEVGDIVLAIGNPFGVGQTVTSGIVSALARTNVGVADFRSFIQTDAAINPGNSGGALVTLDGGLVGINTAIYSRSGGSIGIGFAVPSNMVATVVAAAKGGTLVRPWFGAGGQTVTAEFAGSLGLDRPRGVLLNEVYPGGPADRAGLRVGDVVEVINGREVSDGQELRFRIAILQVGGSVQLKVLRKGKAIAVAVPLEAPPRKPAPDKTTISGRNPLSGAVTANLSPALAEEIGADSTARGVVVLDIQAGAIAARFRITRGDMVSQVNGIDIKSVADLRRVLAAGAPEWQIIMIREGRPFRITVRG